VRVPSLLVAIVSTVLLCSIGPLACASASPEKPASAAPATSTAKAAVRRIRVDARRPAVRVGRYDKGASVQLKPVGGTWRTSKDAPALGPEGDPRHLCIGDEAHHCIGGDALFARMSLVVLVSACDVYQPNCPILAREFVGEGATFSMPVDGELWLGPNDWVEELGDNEGAIDVEVSP
jgi:hypothetical protein